MLILWHNNQLLGVSSNGKTLVSKTSYQGSNPCAPALRQAQGFCGKIIAMSWLVYILFCDQKTFYIGITSNLDKRLKEHKSGYSPYTKKFSEIKLVYQERHSKKSTAEKRESQLKGWTIAKKKALIAGSKDLLIKLSKSFESSEGRC